MIKKVINKSEMISSYKFARSSDVVFAESLTSQQFELLNIKNYKIFQDDGNRVIYRLTKLELYENQVIFCHTDFLDHLFNFLKNCDFKNIKLITNQTDTLITKKIYNKKPRCISQWYSVNVGYKDEGLIPIPLGIANEYEKNLSENEITQNAVSKDDKLYLNFRENTSYKHRHKLYEYFSVFDWSISRNPDLDNNDYSTDLSRYKFVLCPWGNGVDTHRIWETLYSGSVPVTKQHLTLSTLKDIPVVFYENYKEITYKELTCNTYSNCDFNNEKLYFEWWNSKIQNTKIPSEFNKQVFNSDLKNFDTKLLKKIRYERKLKKFLYYYNRIRYY